VRAVIAEDSILLRAGICRLLESDGIEVVDAVGDAEALLVAARTHRPDLALVDVRMPPTHKDEGIRAALLLRDELPDMAILVLSQYVEVRYATELLAGRTAKVGYLLKERIADVDEFVAALRRVAAGGTALDPEVVAQILLQRGGHPVHKLTPREHDVLTLMAQGLSNSGVAAELSLSESSVAKHINSIFTKFDLPPNENNTHRRVLAVLRFLET
jgi:DNA-binding NarL/FixJ family response regulator